MEIRKVSFPTEKTLEPVNSSTNLLGLEDQVIQALGQRRFANEPDMMRELRRYQRLMLLTLLPKVVTTTVEAEAMPMYHTHDPHHPHAHAHDPRFDGATSSRRSSLIEEHHVDFLLSKMKTSDAFPEVPHQLSPPRRDSITIHELPTANQQIRNNDTKVLANQQERIANALANKRHSLDLGSSWPRNQFLGNDLPTNQPPQQTVNTLHPASAGACFPITTAQQPAAENLSQRRLSIDDVKTKNSHGEDTTVAPGGELDLLTLTALFLESRHKVFGQELSAKPENTSRNAGAIKPRRLSPMSNKLLTEEEFNAPYNNTFNGVLPAAAGLHLSVNYTHNLDLEESAFMAERAKALRPRLRRPNSLETVPASSSEFNQLSPEEYLLHRTISEPSVNPETRNSSPSDRSPNRVTPARANTPTDEAESAHISRPQMMGASMATSGKGFSSNANQSLSSSFSSQGSVASLSSNGLSKLAGMTCHTMATTQTLPINPRVNQSLSGGNFGSQGLASNSVGSQTSGFTTMPIPSSLSTHPINQQALAILSSQTLPNKERWSNPVRKPSLTSLTPNDLTNLSSLTSLPQPMKSGFLAPPLKGLSPPRVPVRRHTDTSVTAALGCQTEMVIHPLLSSPMAPILTGVESSKKTSGKIYLEPISLRKGSMP